MQKREKGANLTEKEVFSLKPAWYEAKKYIWITPAIYCAIAVALSIASFYLDLLFVGRMINVIHPVFVMNVAVGKDVMGTLATAILTMTTFTFSTLLVVLSTYSSQFSPRSPENLVHAQTTRRVLGIFLGGFIYTALSLLYMQDRTFSHEVVTPSIGILITFFCVATFAYFIHYVSSNIQVSTLVNKLTADTSDVITKYEKLQQEHLQVPGELNLTGTEYTIKSHKEGYIQFIDLIGLVEIASKWNREIKVLVRTGDYIMEGTPLLNIYEADKEEVSLEDFFTVGSERTVEQDIGYAFQKLMEVAIRAISPSLNDPNTANEILIRVGSLLGKMGQLKTSGWILKDSNGQARVSYDFPSYGDLLYEVYYQISSYGKNDISVLAAMSESLKIAAKSTSQERYEDLWEIQQYILDNLDFDNLKKLDIKFLYKQVSEMAILIGQKNDEALLTTNPSQTI